MNQVFIRCLYGINRLYAIYTLIGNYMILFYRERADHTCTSLYSYGFKYEYITICELILTSTLSIAPNIYHLLVLFLTNMCALFSADSVLMELFLENITLSEILIAIAHDEAVNKYDIYLFTHMERRTHSSNTQIRSFTK